jgi:hypothetical protein
VLCTPDAVLSAEQSCAAPADPQLPAELRDAVVRRQREARPMQESRAQPKPEVQQRPRDAAWDEAGQQLEPPKPKSQARFELRLELRFDLR